MKNSVIAIIGIAVIVGFVLFMSIGMALMLTSPPPPPETPTPTTVPPPTTTVAPTPVPTTVETPVPTTVKTTAPTPVPTTRAPPTTTRPTPVPTTQYSDEDYNAVIKAVLGQYVYSVESVRTVNGHTKVVYRSSAMTTEDLSSEMGAASGAYASTVAHGLSTSQMDVRINAIDGTPIAHYTVKREWALAWRNDQITDTELFGKVMGTFDTY